MKSLSTIITIVVVVLFLSLCTHSVGAVAFEQPHNGSNSLYLSAWLDPDGSDWDEYVWDDFTLPSNQAITEVHWRGGFVYGQSYSGPVVDFTVAIYPSIAVNTQPDVSHPPLVRYHTNSNANQTNAGTFGGVAMYDYHFTLPSAFQASANVRYWVQIEAYQHGIPEWSLAGGTGGDSHHFRHNYAMYQNMPGDVAFSLMSSSSPTYTIDASVSPAGSGVIQGVGQYPQGTTATLVASANAGWGFARWTENNVQVSTNASYTFAVTANRTLVANFVPAYSITTSSWPSFGGTTSGGGTFNSGTMVTVSATANPGFQFSAWTEYGTVVSNSPSYAFAASADRPLVAQFVNVANSITFDFDNAPQYTSLPMSLTVNNLTANLSATGSGFSIQSAGVLGFTPQGFSGLCLYPNSVFAADLVVNFSQPLTFFSIMYSPQELGCDTSALMRVTVYKGGAFVATNTATAPVPGTWPTGTLSINALNGGAGFDSAVVHYQSKPPTCQDWGPIFLADNMVVTTAPQANPCPGDVTHNGFVNVDDLLMVINSWGACTGCAADVNNNGFVNVDDLLAVINGWGACP